MSPFYVKCQLSKMCTWLCFHDVLQTSTLIQGSASLLLSPTIIFTRAANLSALFKTSGLSFPLSQLSPTCSSCGTLRPVALHSLQYRFDWSALQSKWSMFGFCFKIRSLRLFGLVILVVEHRCKAPHQLPLSEQTSRKGWLILLRMQLFTLRSNHSCR